MQKKSLFFILGLSFVLLFTNCSEEESDETKLELTSQKILGEWLEVGAVEEGQEFYYEDYEESYDEDGELCLNEYNFYPQGRLERKFCIVGNIDNAQYTVLDEEHVELVLMGSSGEYTVISTIKILTENKMILEWSRGSFETIKIFRK